VTIVLTCSDDGLRQCRKIYIWLLKNSFNVVFNEEDELAGVNLFNWAEGHIKQVRHCHVAVSSANSPKSYI